MNFTEWMAQVRAVMRLELKKTFFARRGLWIYVLALLPVALFTVHTIFELYLRRRGTAATIGQSTFVFAGVFQFFFLRLAIFFGALGIFMNLFRGEMLDKSLHFYLLAPIKREVLLVGKYLAGLVAASVIFAASTALQWIAILWAFDARTVSHFLNAAGGWQQILTYMGVAVLASVGYGSVFLAAGLFVRNPIISAAGILIWEAANPVLPALLKKFSVIYYLKTLCPINVPVDPGMPPLLALLASGAQPIAAGLAICGLLLLSVAILAGSMRRVRRLEINYTAD